MGGRKGGNGVGSCGTGLDVGRFDDDAAVGLFVVNTLSFVCFFVFFLLFLVHE